eukprot:TRINITY_DN10771_c0_g4_i3.p1 TRINITY_DN10771_c0_g4~~TRINITY_DN10771_c0_g4_i3.p1  ORF type:complete len:141 (-),score=13.94 TRINITY_DN10771_c0_g4_i3:261-638(-)
MCIRDRGKGILDFPSIARQSNKKFLHDKLFIRQLELDREERKLIKEHNELYNNKFYRQCTVSDSKKEMESHYCMLQSLSNVFYDKEIDTRCWPKWHLLFRKECKEKGKGVCLTVGIVAEVSCRSK